ncbi:polyphosphate kinase 1 [Youngiibacter fragilis]|uniref:Polyphosphate kinase n=1 Tax=Youngiibacter fragilis 232.1 TaxID=994573 RepID=V7I3X4_9CLOT|nr:polyphosphate kinase 1 [Youngiibacter fragilis]ETA80950.1 polyphosphate kinase [Youngiibacter fragilis 232.1]
MSEVVLSSSNFINREISFLEFNERVLDEARNTDNPLFERIKFAAIVVSNLDEFYMIRYGSLSDQIHAGLERSDPSGRSPVEQAKAINERTRLLLDDLYECYTRDLVPALSVLKISFLKQNELTEKQKEYVSDLYWESIFPVLTPMVIDSSRPFPLIMNNSLNIAMLLREKKPEGREFVGTIQVPSVLDRYHYIPSEESGRKCYMLLEDIIKMNLKDLFNSHEILDYSCYRISRNADLEYDEEDAEDLLEVIKETLKQRKWGRVIKMEVERGVSLNLLGYLREEFELGLDSIFSINGPPDLTYLFKVSSMQGFEHLKFEETKPLPVPELTFSEDMFQSITKQDVLVHHPYDSFDSIIRFVKSAAADPNVLAIKQTLYRVSGRSPIVEALAEAAENGKQVTVLVELKARFDEQNNIVWARRLEKAGCHVIYGIVGMKTHCKALLIVRRENNRIKRYVHVGTGNYNDVTARLYSDVGLFSANEDLATDISDLFNMLSGQYQSHMMKVVSLAPDNMRSSLIARIENERRNARQGRRALIVAKMNSLVDKDIIRNLYLASQDGVEIRLIIRGICCLRPGIEGTSENIRVFSIVGRFLEHSRIFYFFNGGTEDILISSADWMERNLNKRIELMVPVQDKKCKEKLKVIIDFNLRDNVKSKELMPDGKYVRTKTGGEAFNAQEEFIEKTKKRFEKYKKRAAKAGTQ